MHSCVRSVCRIRCCARDTPHTMLYVTSVVVYVLFAAVTHGDDFCVRNVTDLSCRTMRDSRVHKCYCGLNEVWHNPYCLPQATTIPVIQFDPWTNRSVAADTFRGSVVAKLNCSAGELLVPLTDHSFYLLASGKLLHLFTGVIYPLPKYCVEHVVDYARRKVRLGGFTCVARPQIPLCCDNGEYLDRVTFTCVHDPQFAMSPPIFREPTVLRWKSLPGYQQGLPQCYDREIYRQFDLDGGRSAVLLYRSNGIFLHWKAAPRLSARLVEPHEYCVAAERHDDGRFYHSAFICHEPRPLITVDTRSEHRSGSKRPLVYVLPVMYYFLGNA